MKTYLNRFMSLLGYVPAGPASAISNLKIALTIDSTPVDAAIAKLERLTAASHEAEAALFGVAADALITSPAAQFAAAELAVDETSALLLAELRKQTTLLEVLAKQGDRAMFGGAILKTCIGTAGPELSAPATGANASGLSG